MRAVSVRSVLFLGLAWLQPGLANNATIDLEVCPVPQMLINQEIHGGHWANNFPYFSPHEQYIPALSSRTTAVRLNKTWVPAVVNNMTHRNFTYTFYGTIDCVDSWGPNDTLRYGHNVTRGTNCTINPVLGYSCKSPGMCRQPSWLDYETLTTGCSIETTHHGWYMNCDEITTCDNITTCLGYTTTSYGNCSNMSNCTNVTAFFDNCTTMEVCNTETQNCMNTSNDTTRTVCNETTNVYNYSNKTSFENDWDCKGLCWQNTSDYGIDNWTHESCIIGFQGDGEYSPGGMSGGQPLVFEGQYCGIIPTPGYKCTDPGYCQANGTFEREGFCKALCPLPKMPYFGFAGWSKGCEDGTVEEGTSCEAMPVEGYVCSSPGMCLPFGNWENEDVECVVAAGLRIQGCNWADYTSSSSANVIEYALGNLTVEYGENYLLPECVDNNTAHLCTGWAKDDNKDGITDCFESQDAILGNSEAYMKFVRYMCPATCGYCLNFSAANVDVHVHNDTRKSWNGIPTYGRRLHWDSDVSPTFDMPVKATNSFRPSYHNIEFLPLMGATITAKSPRQGVDVRPMMFDLVRDAKFLEAFIEGLPFSVQQLCPGITATFYSLTDVAAKDCVGTWSRWRSCDSSCGKGMKTRSYKIIRYEYLDGLKCRAKQDTAECWSGPCPTPSPPTPAPPGPPEAKTPAPTSDCMSLTGKSDRQCARKCNSVADGCPLTCRMCNTNCACTAQAIEEKEGKKVAKREGKLMEKDMKRAAHLAGETYVKKTAPPTPPPTKMPCMLSDDCPRSFFCWYGMCEDTREEEVCDRLYGMETDDGWKWEQLVTHRNFQCEDYDYDHMASRPKAKKHLKSEHLAWAGQRVDQADKSTRGALTQWYQKYAVMPKTGLLEKGEGKLKKNLGNAIKKYSDRDEKAFFQPGGAKHADGYKYPTEVRDYMWDSGKRRLNADVVDGALPKSFSANVLLALLFVMFT